MKYYQVMNTGTDPEIVLRKNRQKRKKNDLVVDRSSNSRIAAGWSCSKKFSHMLCGNFICFQSFDLRSISTSGLSRIVRTWETIAKFYCDEIFMSILLLGVCTQHLMAISSEINHLLSSFQLDVC